MERACRPRWPAPGSAPSKLPSDHGTARACSRSDAPRRTLRTTVQPSGTLLATGAYDGAARIWSSKGAAADGYFGSVPHPGGHGVLTCPPPARAVMHPACAPACVDRQASCCARSGAIVGRSLRSSGTNPWTCSCPAPSTAPPLRGTRTPARCASSLSSTQVRGGAPCCPQITQLASGQANACGR